MMITSKLPLGETGAVPLRSPTLDEQKRFWDWHWEHWQERRTVNLWKDTRHGVILDFLRALALDQPLILDLGCGPGWYTDRLAAFGAVMGVDLSEVAITMARSKFPHITFVSGNLYDLALPAEHFDIVVSQEVFDHVENQSEFIKRVADVLKSHGYLILSCANKFIMERLGDEEGTRQPGGHISRFLDTKALRSLLSAHFAVLQTRSILPMGRHGILRLINSYRVNRAISTVIPSRYLNALKERLGLGYTLVILAQKRR